MIQNEGKIWIQICILADALSSGFVLVAKVFRAIAISYPRRHAIVSDRFEILYCKDSPYIVLPTNTKKRMWKASVHSQVGSLRKCSVPHRPEC